MVVILLPAISLPVLPVSRCSGSGLCHVLPAPKGRFPAVMSAVAGDGGCCDSTEEGHRAPSGDLGWGVRRDGEGLKGSFLGVNSALTEGGVGSSKA